MGWARRPLVIELDDGTLMFASRDDEGNDGGALFGQVEARSCRSRCSGRGRESSREEGPSLVVVVVVVVGRTRGR
jgi:hypothetical protein